MGGSHFRDNGAFLEGALLDAHRLVQTIDLTEHSVLLDVGCGASSSVGILEELRGVAHYTGVDVSLPLVRWGQRHLTPYDRRFRFRHIDVTNERYNPRGRESGLAVRLPMAAGAADVVHAYSVFSHMRGGDIAHYLSEWRRVLRHGGTAIFTVFVEEDVPAEEVNPHNYRRRDWSGALHCVYRREPFEAMVRAAGLAIRSFQYGQETDGQSLYVVTNPGQSAAHLAVAHEAGQPEGRSLSPAINQ